MRFALRILVSASLLVAAVVWIGPTSVLDTMRQARPLWLLLACAMQTIVFVIGVFNIWVLTRALVPEVPHAIIMRSFLRATALGMFAPGKLGELTFPYYLAKAGAGGGVGLAVMLVDKLITLAFVTLVGSIGMALFIDPGPAVLVGGLVLVGLMLVTRLLRHETSRSWVRTKILRSHAQKLQGFDRSLGALFMEHRGAVAVNVGVTGVRILALGAVVVCGFRAFGGEVGILPATALVGVIQTLALIPITVSGIGLVHGAAVLLFSTLLGVDEGAVINAYLLFSVFAYAFSAAVLALTGYRSDIESADASRAG